MSHLLGKLAPAVIKANLLRASLFLSAYELFKIELIDKVRFFYATDFDERGRGIESEAYRQEVLSLAPADCQPNAVRAAASRAWWVKGGVLSDDDIARIKLIKDHRDLIAHELTKLLIDPAFSVDQALFSELRHYIGVLGRFWGRVAMDSDYRFDHQHIPDSDIESGCMVLVGYIAQLVNEQQLESPSTSDPTRL